ncbi:MAG: 23S rRNA (uracil(1939)-C(5))-methyltransferase RlmD [Bacteroidetes bacterium]|nr:23S rRNA (uracil(1939)-C(5))-methyltransferase RlmD [Bacteroidota bacterium]
MSSTSLKKGDQLTEIVVETMAAEGKCIGHYEGRVVFILGCAPGDIVDVELTKIKSSFLEGRASKIHKLSDTRATPFCTHFGLCGGCSWQHLSYASQLQYKQQQVVDNLERLGGLELPPIQPIIGSEQTIHYRNKLDFTFTSNRWLLKEEMGTEVKFGEPGLGYHIPKMFDKVFDVKECFLQPEPSNAIRLRVREIALQHDIPFFDLRKQTGFVRTITIRTAGARLVDGQPKAEEVMVILQVTEDKMEWTEKILSGLAEQFPEITSLNYIINAKRNDTFADLDVICWKGNPFITEKMHRPEGGGELQFRVGPKSFYQTNSAQAYKLYSVAFQMAGLTGTELVYDLYTGTGTIANFIAGKAKKVIGLEYVASAIEDAKVNSALNGIKNTDFFAGDIKDLLSEKFLTEHGYPEVVITDPPRGGMHEDVSLMLLKAAPAKIVYVSCNPATQARDLKILDAHYRVKAVQPVDMFPHTTHVENVVLLEKR